MKKKTEITSEDRANFVIGFVAILAVFAIFTAIIVLSGNRSSGEIAYAGELTRGNEQVFTYKLQNVKKGDTVTWYVNDQEMESYVYNDGDIQFCYTPTEVGDSTVRVVAGKHCQSKTINVGKPLLTVEAKNIEITYGDVPTLEYTCHGLVCGDTEDCVDCEITCENCDKLPCGEYAITLSNAVCDNYEVEFRNATLKVLPKEVKISNSLDKVYDQTAKLNSPTLILEGVLTGDDVYACADSICFESKNVGNYTLDTQDICLQGENASNYFLCKEAHGKILPKEITLQGLTIADKPYDGTTKAQISKMGVLKGVCEGDSVAVGSLDICFDNAYAGQQKICVKNVKLVGYDKDNYTVKNVDVKDAKIIGR